MSMFKRPHQEVWHAAMTALSWDLTFSQKALASCRSHSHSQHASRNAGTLNVRKSIFSACLRASPPRSFSTTCSIEYKKANQEKVHSHGAPAWQPRISCPLMILMSTRFAHRLLTRMIMLVEQRNLHNPAHFQSILITLHRNIICSSDKQCSSPHTDQHFQR